MIQLAHRVVLTELCNGTCPHCFNAEFRKTAVMDADKLIKFWRTNQGDFLKTKPVKLMGGEPTLHPRIIEIMQEACLHFQTVDLFTNGTNMLKISSDPLILKYHMLNVVKYIINGFTFDIDKVEEYLPYVGKFLLHFVIPYDKKEMYELIGKITKCMDLNPLVNIIISPNTQVDLFDDEIQENYRKIWMEAISTVVPRLMARGVSFNYDHVLPMCFYTQEMLDELHAIPGIHDQNSFIDSIHAIKITCCCEAQMGLILPNFDLYFCNQTHIKVGSILDENGEPKLIGDIMEDLRRFSKIKTDCIKNLSPKCADCAVVASCKVGCYYTTLMRSKNELS